MAAPIERLDVPADQLAAESVLREAVARHARAGDWDADEYLSAREAIQLVTHPDAPVSTDADYAAWAAALNASKEM
jgi:hypothetical protein